MNVLKVNNKYKLANLSQHETQHGCDVGGRFHRPYKWLTIIALVVTFLSPSLAFADGGLKFEEARFNYGTQWEVPPGPSMTEEGARNPFAPLVTTEDRIAYVTEKGWDINGKSLYGGSLKVQLMFDKNVGWARDNQDDSFIENNESKVWIEDLDGNRIEGVHAYADREQELRRSISIATDVWLKPLTVYKIVMDEGITAANGSDKLTERQYVEFKTTALTSTGLTVYEIVLIIVGAIGVVAGITAAIIRNRKVLPAITSSRPERT